MHNKVMSKEQALKTIEKLTNQAETLRNNGSKHAAAQNVRIIAKLKRRIASGKYK